MINRRTLVISGAFVLLVVAAVVVALVRNPSSPPIDVQRTDLRKVDKSKTQIYVDQLSTTIEDLPGEIVPATKDKLQKQLGYILREKYGSNSLIGKVRGDMVIDVYDVAKLYIDIAAKNETYLASFKNDGSEPSIICAPQDMQYNPETSQCVTAPADDSYQFKHG